MSLRAQEMISKLTQIVQREVPQSERDWFLLLFVTAVVCFG